MEDFVTWAYGQISSNEMLIGIVGGSGFAAVLYGLRGVPRALLWAAERQFSVELVVDNGSEAFMWVSEWLAGTKYAKRSRRLKLSEGADRSDMAPSGPDGGDDARWLAVPGEGVHVFLYRGRPIVVEHSVDRENSRGSFLRETLRIKVPGRSQATVRSILSEALALRRERAGVLVYRFDDYWQRCGRKNGRDVASIFLKPGQMEALIADARWFGAAADWYAERGVPYRRGYLLEGPPGTGKTSAAMVLATALDRPIYIANLGSIDGDAELIRAFANVPSTAILLVEDVDAAHAAGQRKKNGEKKGEKEPISLSALLNAIDGIAAADGRILVMTTNHRDKLDPALIRPGRADRIEHFGPIKALQGASMYRRFFPDADRQSVQAFIAGAEWPRPAAAVQGELLELAQEAGDGAVREAAE